MGLQSIPHEEGPHLLRKGNRGGTAPQKLQQRYSGQSGNGLPQSWYGKSTDWIAKISPVNPPITKQTTNPTKIVNPNDLNPISVRPKVHEKILIAVGITIIAVADEES